MKIECPDCGSKDCIKRGFLYTRQGKSQRYQCKKCGKWFSATTSVGTRILMTWLQEQYKAKPLYSGKPIVLSEQK